MMKTKKVLSVLLAILMFCSISAVLPAARADVTSGTFGDCLYWKYDNSKLSLTRGYNSETGSMRDLLLLPPWEHLKAFIEEVNVAYGITDIRSFAFSGCSRLTWIDIPGSVSTIYGSAFNGCALYALRIPVSVTLIKQSAFAGCGKLSDVYYDGTPEQWAAIMIEDSNDALKNATVHYGEPLPAHRVHKKPLLPTMENIDLATCTEGGSYDLVYRCTGCGLELSRSTVETSPKGHSFTSGKYRREADGTYTQKCSRLGCNTYGDPVNELPEGYCRYCCGKHDSGLGKLIGFFHQIFLLFRPNGR
ncbi:MAG: leucine-rich repeat domain-containing protein [Clostridia bacterium]|nr:leucine-rich repeat domain-containing protein [Clostridia bacterium]MBR0538325.1 leucine-rich repeat domain-containing protein [Clostridia bacterium]